MVLVVVDMTFWKTWNAWSVAKNENSKECYWNVIHSLEWKKTVMKSHVSHCGRFLKQVSIWKQTRQPHNFGSWADHDQIYIQEYFKDRKTTSPTLLFAVWLILYLLDNNNNTKSDIVNLCYVTTLAKAWCEVLWLLQT